MTDKTKRLLLSVGALGLICLLAELVLSFLPTPHNTDWMPVNDKSPVLRHRPNSTTTWSCGPTLALATRRKSNNDGFLNDQDYDKVAHGPLLAVIGDSFVEAMMVPYDRTFYGRLADVIGQDGRIYSFGISSAPLSQYLAWAQYAYSAYRPRFYIFVVIANDFDESFHRYKNSDGISYFPHDASTNNVVLERHDLAPSRLRKCLMSPALARYLFYNLKMGHFWSKCRMRFLHLGKEKPVYVGNVPFDMCENRIQDAMRATDLFLAAIPDSTGTSKQNVLFVVDGIRPQLYDEKDFLAVTSSYWARMRCYFMSQAVSMGYEAIDMNPIIMSHYKQTGERAETQYDNHWDVVGHKLVAEAITRSEVWRRFSSALSPDRGTP